MKTKTKALQQAQQALTQRYKTCQKTGILSDAERQVYLSARMPATKAVCLRVFKEVVLSKNPQSLLDLGCGPGTATTAALSMWSSIKKAHLIDQDNGYSYDLTVPYIYTKANLGSVALSQSYDIVVLSYVLNECDIKTKAHILKTAYNHTSMCLIVIEPGTPAGYQSFLKTRSFLIKAGAFIQGACPHERDCPLSAPNWCHFKERLARSATHQTIKKGNENFEDESYIYGIFSKSPPNQRKARVITKPRLRSGHIRLDLCTPIGLKETVVSRKEKDLYQKAKKATWGSVFSSSEI